MPLSRRAPVNVVVFQCPCGTPARHRSPRFARPRRRAIFVDRPISLRGPSVRQRTQGVRDRGRAGPRTTHACASGRPGGPAPMRARTFFERPVPLAEPGAKRRAADRNVAFGQMPGHLIERDVRLLIDHTFNEGRMSVQTRAMPPAPPPRSRLTVLALRSGAAAEPIRSRLQSQSRTARRPHVRTLPPPLPPTPCSEGHCCMLVPSPPPRQR